MNIVINILNNIVILALTVDASKKLVILVVYERSSHHDSSSQIKAKLLKHWDKNIIKITKL